MQRIASVHPSSPMFSACLPIKKRKDEFGVQ